jgi:hypothetical protein
MVDMVSRARETNKQKSVQINHKFLFTKPN